MPRNFYLKVLLRDRSALIADLLAAAALFSVPWSTSATSVMIVLWLIVLIPTLSSRGLYETLLTPAGGLPVALFILAALGIFWADVDWATRLHGLRPYYKLLAIPLLLIQFRRSNRGMWVLLSFLISCMALLVASWFLVIFQDQTLWRERQFGVPVRDYIAQSSEFLLCSIALAAVVFNLWRKRRGMAVLAACLSSLFLANILYTTTGRTALVVLPFLILALAYRQLQWRGIVAAVFGCAVLGPAIWFTSSNLQNRVYGAFEEVQEYVRDNRSTNSGLRIEFYVKSFELISRAPLLGHGTGTISSSFAKLTVGETGATSVPTANPHNQLFAVAIPLGLVGAGLLLAMWASHLLLFRSADLVDWIGLVVVLQNVISSMFNSHLMDFAHGWLYVLGLSVAGGVTLKSSLSSPLSLAGRRYEHARLPQDTDRHG